MLLSALRCSCVLQARPSRLNDVVCHAVELEVFNRAERRHLKGKGYMSMASEKSSEENSHLEEKLKALEKRVFELQKIMMHRRDSNSG